MKIIRIATMICTVISLTVACAGNETVKEPDFSGLTSENHPRVIYTDADFAAIAQQVAEGTNTYLTKMHEIIINTADNLIGAPDLTRTVIGKRLLDVSRAALKRIVYCSYAYKMTGEEKYLKQAEHDIRTVCDFEDWNAIRHFLDAGEMSAAVGLAYDWLYNDLSDGTKIMVRKALDDFAFHPALYEKESIFNVESNWNSVCNGGMICAALAVYEDDEETARAIIDKGLKGNVICMTDSYFPNGNYAEGYSYWNYGTMYEALLLTAMETATGSDNGLSSIDGFSETGKYMIFMEGTTGQCFNYSDCGPKVFSLLPQWYFAWKFGDLSVLYLEKDKTPSAPGLLPLFAWYASKVDVTNIPAPRDNIFYGDGITPVVLVHDTWTMDENDKFLGVKGGSGHTSHAHLDAGSFVFDAEGVRWASDLGTQSYTELEAALPDIWAMKDGSDRWRIFRYNNFNHNTLTVNDTYQKVNGKAKLLEVIDSDGKRGAVIDITEPLGDEVASAVRTIYIRGNDLVVEDKITAMESKAANVRWTMVTPAEPVIENGAITLVQEGKTRYMVYSSSTNHEVDWNIWSAQSSNSWDDPNPGFHECGYTMTVNPGDTAMVEIRLTPER